jgi:hypothetical protein
MRQLLVLGLLVFVFSSCKKANERTCWKSAGAQTTKIIPVAAFEKLELYEHIKYTLIQDSLDYIEIKAGKNLIDLIDVNSMNSILKIENLNRCNFLGYQKRKVVVEIHIRNLKEIYFKGTDSLVNKGILNLDNLNVEIEDGAGSIDFNLNAESLNFIVPHGWGDFKLKGFTKFFRVDIDGSGYFDTRELQVQDSISVISISPILSKINGDNCKLKVELNGEGDLWYYGNPSILLKNEYNSGRVIKKD